MNTRIFTISTIVMISFNGLRAQVPNGNFEDWSVDQSLVPTNWQSSGKISQTPGNKSSNAIRLNNDLLTNTVSFLFQTGSDTGKYYAPSFAYPATPDSIVITYKAQLGADTAVLQAAFTKHGYFLPVAFCDIAINDNTNQWVTQAFPIVYINPSPSLTADSGYIMIYSGDPQTGPLDNSYLIIDQISFKFSNNSPAPDIPNYSLENWESASVEYPKDWVSYPLFMYNQGSKGHFTSKSSESEEGAYALELVPFATINPNTGKTDTFPNAAVTMRSGSNPDDADLNVPSFPLTDRYTSFRGNYKTSLAHGDLLTVWVNIFKGQTLVGSAFFTTGDQSDTFTEFSTDITWDTSFTDNPDSATVAVMLTDSTFNGIDNLESRAVVDHLRFDNWNASVTREPVTEITIYPNPSRGIFFIPTGQLSESNLNIAIRNTKGQCVYRTQVIPAKSNMIRLETGLPAGVYFISVASEKINQTKRVIITP